MDKISASFHVTRDIRITNLAVEASSTDVVSVEDFSVHNINGHATLPNSNSYVKYRVEVTNIGNAVMGISSITGLPNNLEYQIEGYNLNEKMCDNSGKCALGVKKNFTLL